MVDSEKEGGEQEMTLGLCLVFFFFFFSLGWAQKNVKKKEIQLREEEP